MLFCLPDLEMERKQMLLEIGFIKAVTTYIIASKKDYKLIKLAKSSNFEK